MYVAVTFSTNAMRSPKRILVSTPQFSPMMATMLPDLAETAFDPNASTAARAVAWLALILTAAMLVAGAAALWLAFSSL